jgi:tyrosine-protein phosphatase non-receptor type 12/18/22
MADTYAVVQKRGAPAGPAPSAQAHSTLETPLYSQVTPRALRPVAHAEDARGALPGRGEWRLLQGRRQGGLALTCSF